ncbi:hypothetical protein [Streptomyces sp. KL116D]
MTVPLVFGAAAGLDAATVAVLINADLLVAGVSHDDPGRGDRPDLGCGCR